MAVNRIFGAIAQSGGTVGALDSINSSSISTNDMAIVKDNTLNAIHYYVYSGSSTTTASLPKVIAPVDVGVGSGRWLLVSESYFTENLTVDTGKYILSNDLYGFDAALKLGYTPGNVALTISDTTIAASLPITTTSSITSTLPTGTAPITTSSTTLCTGLNAEFFNGITSTNVSLLNDNTNKYSVIPRVTDSVLIVPIADADFTTKVYVDDLVSGAFDGTIYSLLDGTRPYTGVPILDVALDAVASITDSRHLSTKGYVDSVVITSHSGLTNLSADDHAHYILVDGTRPYTGVPILDVALNEITSITDVRHLASKGYVDDLVSGVSTVAHSSLTGLSSDDHTQYSLVNGTRPYLGVVGGVDPIFDSNFVTKSYSDFYTNRVLLSSTDAFYDFLQDKIETNPAVGVTTIYDGTNTGVIVEKTSELAGTVADVTVANGGTTALFFVRDSKDVGYPNTFLDVTNGGIFDNLGVSGTDLTETQLYPVSDTNPGAGDAEVRIRNVIGDVEYMEIVDGGAGLIAADDWYSFTLVGDYTTISTWEAQVVSGTIVAVRRNTTGFNAGVGVGYTYALDVTYIEGISGIFVLRPYIVGTIAGFTVPTYGDGYTSASYNLTEATKASYTITGYGTAGSLGDLDVTFINPVSEKLKYSHFKSTTTPVDLYISGYTVTAGANISGISFDSWGHIVEITEASAQPAWELKTGTDFEIEYSKSYFVDPSAAARIITLPYTVVRAPVIGDFFIIDNHTKDASLYNLTIQAHAGDGGSLNLLVEGVASQDVVIDVDGARVIMTYVDGTYGWRYKVI
jgi:hypothetical protein